MPPIRNDIKKHLDDGLNPGNIMVLARNKYEPEQIVKSLDDNVRRVMKNPNPVIDNRRVQAAISLIDAIKNPQDNRAVIGYVNATLGGTFFELSQEERREEVETVREAIEVLKERKGKRAAR